MKRLKKNLQDIFGYTTLVILSIGLLLFPTGFWVWIVTDPISDSMGAVIMSYGFAVIITVLLLVLVYLLWSGE